MNLKNNKENIQYLLIFPICVLTVILVTLQYNNESLISRVSINLYAFIIFLSIPIIILMWKLYKYNYIFLSFIIFFT